MSSGSLVAPHHMHAPNAVGDETGLRCLFLGEAPAIQDDLMPAFGIELVQNSAQEPIRGDALEVGQIVETLQRDLPLATLVPGHPCRLKPAAAKTTHVSRVRGRGVRTTPEGR
jgi:hypothetical protein